jgi:hypothetical protein
MRLLLLVATSSTLSTLPLLLGAPSLLLPVSVHGTSACTTDRSQTLVAALTTAPLTHVDARLMHPP